MKLKYYGGQGFGYSKEIGEYEVKATEKRHFTKLSEARAYYDSLKEEKAIWDISGAPELLEAHFLDTPKI